MENTLQKFWRYNKVYLGELVPLEILGDHLRGLTRGVMPRSHPFIKHGMLYSEQRETQRLYKVYLGIFFFQYHISFFFFFFFINFILFHFIFFRTIHLHVPISESRPTVYPFHNLMAQLVENC